MYTYTTPHALIVRPHSYKCLSSEMPVLGYRADMCIGPVMSGFLVSIELYALNMTSKCFFMYIHTTYTACKSDHAS